MEARAHHFGKRRPLAFPTWTVTAACEQSLIQVRSFTSCCPFSLFTISLLAASARTYVPISVYNDIRRSWFHQRNNVPGVSGWTSDTFLPDANPFQNHDIIFKFKGLDDDEVEFRCSAERFLVSPWFRPNEGFVVPFKAFCPTGDGDPEVATLGMVSIPC